MNATHFQTKLIEQFNNEIRNAETLEQLKAAVALLWKVSGLAYYAIAFTLLFAYEHARPGYLYLKGRYTTWREQQQQKDQQDLALLNHVEELVAEVESQVEEPVAEIEIPIGSESVFLPVADEVQEVINSLPQTGGLATEELVTSAPTTRTGRKSRQRKQS